MYFLGDLKVLYALVEQASRIEPNTNATSPDITPPDENVNSRTPSPTPNDVAQPNDMEETLNGT